MRRQSNLTTAATWGRQDWLSDTHIEQCWTTTLDLLNPQTCPSTHWNIRQLQINGCNEEIERKLNYSCLENNPPEKGERNRESEREREREGGLGEKEVILARDPDNLKLNAHQFCYVYTNYHRTWWQFQATNENTEKISHHKPGFHLALVKGTPLTQLVCQPRNSVCCTWFWMDSLCYYISHTSSFPQASFVLKAKR